MPAPKTRICRHCRRAITRSDRFCPTPTGIPLLRHEARGGHVDADRIARGLRANAEAYHAGTLSHDAFGSRNRALWRQAEAISAAPLVTRLLRQNGWI